MRMGKSVGASVRLFPPENTYTSHLQTFITCSEQVNVSHHSVGIRWYIPDTAIQWLLIDPNFSEEN